MTIRKIRILAFILPLAGMLIMQSHYMMGQKQISLNGEFDCIEFSESKEDLIDPLNVRTKYMNLEIQWITEIDSIFDRSNLSGDELIWDDYFYHPVLNKSVINLKSGEIYKFGHPIFENWFEQDDLFIQYTVNSLNRVDSLVSYSPLTGEEIHRVKGRKPLENYYYEFSKELFYMIKGGRFGYEKYLINARNGEIVWKETTKYPISYYSRQKWRDYVVFDWEYNNREIDSSLYIMKIQNLKTGELVAEYHQENGKFFRFHINSDKLIIHKKDYAYKINPETWEVEKCIQDVSGKYIKNGNKRIYSNKIVNIETGEHEFFGKYDMLINAKWNDNLIYRATDHEGNHFYMLTDAKQTELQELFFTFKKGLSIPECSMRDIYYGNGKRIQFANSSSNITLAYFHCNGKTYFTGVKIIEKDLGVDEAIKRRGY